MTRVKIRGLGALLLLVALSATGCLEQPSSAWVDTQPEEQPVVIIDGIGSHQERPAPHVPRRIPTAPPTTHLTTPLATSPKEVSERDTRIASPTPAEQVVKRPEVIRGNEIPVSSGATVSNSSGLRWIDPDEKSPAEAYIAANGGSLEIFLDGGNHKIAVLPDGTMVIFDYAETLSFENISLTQAGKYTYEDRGTFVVATPKQR